MALPIFRHFIIFPTYFLLLYLALSFSHEFICVTEFIVLELAAETERLQHMPFHVSSNHVKS